MTDSEPPEVSVVMPCLDEVETVGACVHRAAGVMREHAIRGEVVVADNGSRDGSIEAASAAGARVVHAERRGYGHALRAGIDASRGRYVIMGDADESYDFGEIPRFLERLRDGDELVLGCRLPAGGGTILPGAMPFLHRWWGNPMLSWIARRWFRAPIHDVYCGLRGFSRELVERIQPRSGGMEFATEMIIRASLAGVTIGEIPVTLRPDGRSTNGSHLRTFRDGWRTLRFFLLYSPRRLFLLPGAGLIVLGALAYALALPGATIAGVTFDAHTLLVGSLSILVGIQSIVFGIFTRTYAVERGILPASPELDRWLRIATLERGILAGGVAVVAGLALIAVVVVTWGAGDFGRLDYAVTMRWVIPGVTLTAIGVQVALSSFFLGILRLDLDRS